MNWQQSNKRWVATFYFPRDDEAVHVVPGDELVLQHETGVFVLRPPLLQSCCENSHRLSLCGATW